jgi:pentatricopeptide repeat protein
MDEGWSTDRQAFVEQYGSDVLDSSLLRMPAVGFISPHDPMWASTLVAMDGELVSDSLVYRYDPGASPDGLQGSEGTFSLCSFLYVDALARAGRVEDARLAFEKMLTYANHVGLYSEEIALSGAQIGNFPQAFTHLALIRCRAQPRRSPRPGLLTMTRPPCRLDLTLEQTDQLPIATSTRRRLIVWRCPARWIWAHHG